MFNNFGFPAAYEPLGSQFEYSLSGVQDLQAPNGARGLLIQALAQNVRVTIDGSTPVTGSGATGAGFQLAAGSPAVLIPVRGKQMVKVIHETSGAVVTGLWVKASA